MSARPPGRPLGSCLNPELLHAADQRGWRRVGLWKLARLANRLGIALHVPASPDTIARLRAMIDGAEQDRRL